MNEDVKKRWVKALRSGEYDQGTGGLKEDGFCCLGVLCDLHRKETGGEWNMLGLIGVYLGEQNFLPNAVMEWAGLTVIDPVVKHNDYMDNLSTINDSGADFNTIADLIEAQL